MLLVALPLLAWTAWGLGGSQAAARLTARYGERLLAHSDGKFTDAEVFTAGRLKEAVELLTMACLLGLGYQGACGLLERRLKRPTLWIAQGWAAFVGLNIFVGAAAHTALFWCALYTGKESVDNYAQWRIKQELMKETKAPEEAVLLGASQTRSQIDAKALNDRLGREIWTTELHFPGSTPFDMILCLEKIPRERVKYVITYSSEANFYLPGDNGRLMYFLGLGDLPLYWRLGAGRPEADRYFASGLLGDIFPLYRAWEPLMMRVRGKVAEEQKQAQYDASLNVNLNERAKRVAEGMSLGPWSEYQKNAFRVFAQMCRKRGARLVICCGQLNPVLERALNPALRADMLNFLCGLAKEDPNVVLLSRDELPAQGESDYEDLTHVNEKAREQFSNCIAGVLEDLEQGQMPEGGTGRGVALEH